MSTCDIQSCDINFVGKTDKKVSRKEEATKYSKMQMLCNMQHPDDLIHTAFFSNLQQKIQEKYYSITYIEAKMYPQINTSQV